MISPVRSLPWVQCDIMGRFDGREYARSAWGVLGGWLFWGWGKGDVVREERRRQGSGRTSAISGPQ